MEREALFSSAMSDASSQSEVMQGDFPHTRWSLVSRAKKGEDTGQALSELCEQYWYPLYAFVRRKGYGKADAEDLTQGFFSQLLKKDRIQLFSEEKGRLRAYLLGAIKNYISNERAKALAQKRGGGRGLVSFDAEVAESRYLQEPDSPGSPETLFKLRWALDLLERAFVVLEKEYHGGGKGELFAALKPCIGGDQAGVTHADLADQLGISEGNARVSLYRARKRYRRVLEELIADTVTDEVEDEIDDLHRFFSEL
jgi:RNA polymerase sigma-70 factor (ECF subfamily)